MRFSAFSSYFDLSLSYRFAFNMHDYWSQEDEGLTVHSSQQLFHDFAFVIHWFCDDCIRHLWFYELVFLETMFLDNFKYKKFGCDFQEVTIFLVTITFIKNLFTQIVFSFSKDYKINAYYNKYALNIHKCWQINFIS